MPSSNSNPGSEAEFVRRTLILIGIFVAVGLAVMLKDLFILVFGSIVIAVLLTAIANPIARALKLKHGLALAVSIVLLVSVISGTLVLFGSQIGRQADQIGERLPVAWETVRQEAADWGIELPVLSPPIAPETPDPEGEQSSPDSEPEAGLEGIAEAVLSRIGAVVVTTFTAIANALLVIAGGIYLAAQPKLYRTGLIKLFAAGKRPLVDEAFNECGKALKLWLLGTVISMGIVGTFTAFGLWLLGVESWLALGFFAGVLEFVPIIDPIIAAIPAILLAFAQSPELALATAGLFIVVQQVEGNIVQPIVQRYAVDLPPALLLFSVVAGGYLFNLVDILFAAPLTVTGFVLIKRLYVRETLNTDTPMPHE